MYKYIATDDKKKLAAITNYYKSLYNRIAIIVGVFGLIVLPFLRYIIKMDEDIPHLELYYILSLVNTVSSYLFVYKTTIVSSAQKGYRLKIVSSIIEILKLLTQLVALFVFRSYLAYSLVWIFYTILNNIIRSKLAEKWYPFMNNQEQLDVSEKKTIWNNIKAMFIYKIGGVVMNHTDNILMSVLINTNMVGIYSNYNLIFRKLDSYCNLIFSSITASVGNLNVTATNERKYFIFKVFMLISFLFFAICAIEVFFVGEDVVMAMVQNKEYILPKSVFYIGILYFFVSGMCYPCGTFRSTTGLFKLAKYSMLIASALNIVLSIAFGLKFGLFGIILASLVSRLVTNVWYEPLLLYKNFFNERVSKYYFTQLVRTGLVVLMIAIMMPIINLINIDHLYLRILVKGIVCLVIPGVVLLLIYCKKDEFKYLLDKLFLFFKKVFSILFSKSKLKENI